MTDGMPARDPIAEFQDLFARAGAREPDATAMALATADATGAPSVRMVLLKAVDAAGFVFFTNYESRKAGELDVNPRAALCFYWPVIGAQVRVEGHGLWPQAPRCRLASKSSPCRFHIWLTRACRSSGTGGSNAGWARVGRAMVASAFTVCSPRWLVMLTITSTRWRQPSSRLSTTSPVITWVSPM